MIGETATISLNWDKGQVVSGDGGHTDLSNWWYSTMGANTPYRQSSDPDEMPASGGNGWFWVLGAVAIVGALVVLKGRG